MFVHPDRIYYSFGPPRKSTLQAWKLQGLPELDDYECPDEFLISLAWIRIPGS